MMEEKQQRRKGPSSKRAIEGIEIGKLPPQAIDLEESVLGAIMLERNAFILVDEILTSASFYKDANQKIYEVCRSLNSKNEPIDIMSVTNGLKRKGELELVGGAYYVASLTNRVGSAANIEFHAKIVAEKFLKRELIRISSEVLSDAFDDTVDTFDSIDKAESAIKAISTGNSTSLKHISSPMKESVNNYLISKSGKPISEGIMSGIYGWDSLIGRLMGGNLIIIGGRPAMGKTMTMLAIARNNAKQNNRGLIFSLEMTALELTNRLACSDAAVNYDDVKEGKLSQIDESRFMSSSDRINEWPLHIEDLTFDANKIRSIARKFKQNYPDLKYVMLDYVQKMRGKDPDAPFGTRDQQLGYYASVCKNVAKELNVPFILLAQVGRSAEKKGGTLDAKKPDMSDLRESGNLEAEADVVVFPFRPAYYSDCLSDDEKESYERDIWWLFRKNRNGSVGESSDWCDLKTQRIFRQDSSLEMNLIGGSSEFDNFQPTKNFYEVDKQDENQPF